jgi:mRNA-degrading endonuclease RelE of RelBE toxin-antitoxin system
LNSFQIDITLPIFVSDYKAALKKFPKLKTDLKVLLETIETDPTVGDRIPRQGADLYKVRLGLKGQFGKSGGYRLIYQVDQQRKVVTLVALYFKPERPKLTDAEMKDRLDKVAVHIAAIARIEPPLTD